MRHCLLIIIFVLSVDIVWAQTGGIRLEDYHNIRREVIISGTERIRTAPWLEDQTSLRWYEDDANGTNYLALRAAASMAADVTLTLPGADGTSNQVLTTNGSGVLSWANVSALGGAPDSAQYVVMALNGTLGVERVLAEGFALDLTDGGANGSATLALDPTEVIGTTTWGAGAAQTWSWNAGATDPQLVVDSAKWTLTLGAQPDAAHDSLNITGTGAGSGVGIRRMALLEMAAGYTGSARTVTWEANNLSAGIGTDSVGLAANVGHVGTAQGSGAGENVGTVGNADNSTGQNTGILGRSLTATAGKNLGAILIATNSGAGTETGAWIGLGSLDPIPTDAALQVDNGAVAAPIQLWYDNGGEVARVANGGDFGLGTTSPTSVLHVNKGQTTGYDAVRVGNTDTGAAATDGVELRLDDSENALLWQNENTYLGVATNNIERCRIHADGDVSCAGDMIIGAAPGTNPNTQLELRGTVNVAVRLDKTDATARDWQIEVAGDEFRIKDISGNVFPLRIENGAVTNAHFINAAGNVGYGTSSPDYEVDIEHSAATTNTLRIYNPTTAVAAEAQLLLQVDGGAGGADAYITFDSQADWVIGTDNSDNDSFKISGNLVFGANDHFVIEPSGQAGFQITAPEAALHVREPAVGSEVFRIESVATADDPSERVTQYRVVTTDAAAMTMATVPVPSSTTLMVQARIVARRTGGISGTAEDGGGYELTCTYKNVAGAATEMGEAAAVTHEDQAGWNATCTPSAGNVLLQVAGAADNNVSWHGTVRTWRVGT